MPYFSIIIPVYNVAPYLRECLDSVLGQTFVDWEAICVDDGSTDDSATILDEYAEKDSRFRIFHNVNAGVSAARNIALDMAKGTYIAFLDGDDLFSDGLLLNVLSVIRPGTVAVRFKFEKFNHGVDWITSQHKPVDSAVIDISKNLEMESYDSPLWSWIYRRDHIGSLRFDERLETYEDVKFLCLFLLNCASEYVDTNIIGIGYRQRTSSLVHQYPSVRTWQSELMGRVDVLAANAKSEKKLVGIEGRYFVNRFFARGYISGIVHRPRREREMLYNLWLRELPRIIEGFRGRKCLYVWVYQICNALPYYWVAWFCCYFLLERMMKPIRKAARFVLRRGEFALTASGRKACRHLPRFNDNFESLEFLREMVRQNKGKEV